MSVVTLRSTYLLALLVIIASLGAGNGAHHSNAEDGDVVTVKHAPPPARD